ncbi:MAG: TetR/AcrR family transcriptional regulator [Actinobacteria bacterium]|nr:TetR/AcrR family transcriptional regulator [Actinomycetota bacterium]
MTIAGPVRAARGRRSARPSGDDREQAILATAERLLEERPFAEISVDDLARGAGLSRPTFYFYFASKDAVLLTLLDRLLAAAVAAHERLADHTPADRYDGWRAGINVFFEVFGAHRAITRAAFAARTGIPDAQRMWSGFMRTWIDHAAEVIESERAKGAAPVTLPAEDLATALLLLNERAMSSSFTADNPSVPEDRVLDTLVHVWISTIYGEGR